jgi:hypothetical protein
VDVRAAVAHQVALQQQQQQQQQVSKT